MIPTTTWQISNFDARAKALLVKELGIDPLISQILINRNISTPDEVKLFFFPSLNDLHNPFLMKDMQRGVDRIIKAIFNNEKIVIYGDYDADGITSTAVMVKFLREIHTKVDFYIPDRITEGYSLNKDAVARLAQDGAKLIVTVDCGISDIEEIALAHTLGVDVVVIDHHEVPDILPEADAVINPNQPDCPFPFNYLAGVGVAFNFLIALRGTLRNQGFWTDKRYPNLKDYLDLVALGTIADLSPLVDENRVFTKIGLEVVGSGKRVGLKALIEKSGLENKSLDSEAASFNLIPKINAAGRIGSPYDAVKLLLTDNMEEALIIADHLTNINLKRQEMEKDILENILQEIDPLHDSNSLEPLVLASPDWHPGIIGIVASKLVDRYYRPTFLISLKDGIGKGSGRSIEAFNLYNSLKDACASFLLSFGGHRYAAGISIREEDITQFSETLKNVLQSKLNDGDIIPKTYIDVHCHLNEINYNLISQLEMLSPFGNMNPEPVFCAKNVRVVSRTTVGNNHLKMQINDDGISHDSIWFNKGHFSNAISDSTIHIAFTPQLNRWRGSTSIQLKMKDVSNGSHH